MAVKDIPYTHDDLYSPGPQPVYRAETARLAAFPIGGIGTGSVSLTAAGELIDWEIFNRPNKGSFLPFTFFSLWAQRAGDLPAAWVLQAPPQPPFDGRGYGNEPGWGSGVARDTGAGLPHMAGCTLRGEYPFAWLDFEGPDVPLEVSLEAYNPFIPLNADDSGLPAAIFHFTLRNPGHRPVQATLAANLYNAVGQLGPRFNGAGAGQNTNRYIDEQEVRGLSMTSERYPAADPLYGSLALATPWGDLTRKTAWLRARWFDSLQNFWDEFQAEGGWQDLSYGPSEDRRADVGSLGLRLLLEPGESATLPIYITWHCPNFHRYWQPSQSGESKTPADGEIWPNYYSLRFADAFDVARYLAREEPRLHRESLAFHDALHDATLPPYVIDALASQASILKTTTCVQLPDGTFYGFEGCHDTSGCCQGSCTHVWNYAQTHAFLFPALERSMRAADYAYDQYDDGRMSFRIQLPLGTAPWDFHGAADGQMGCIVQMYRDWKLSGRTDWLAGLWPQVTRALEYAWQAWDVDRDGLMEGVQHNTYDVEFWGPNPMTGTLYLAALRAGEEMARALGEAERAATYRAVFESGRARMEAELFNGEYFEQHLNREAYRALPLPLTTDAPQGPDEPKYQHGAGCLSDQMIGQWAAHLAGLGYVLDPAKVQAALGAIFRHNWRDGFAGHSNYQRIYALNDERGLLLCTWPRGGRPRFPFPYSEEVWCGIEYQVAAHLIYEGMLDEGLSIVRGLRERHDGVRRNPWNEFECGNHYARSLASWSLLTALSGFSYDLTRGALGFAPRLTGPQFRSFWSTDTAWGQYTQAQTGAGVRVELAVRYGALGLSELSIGQQGRTGSASKAQATLDGRTLAVDVQSGSGNLLLRLPPGVEIQSGQTLVVEIM